jgi:hypothetical protein
MANNCKATLRKLHSGRMLVVTFTPQGQSFSLDNGEPVGARVAAQPHTAVLR